MKTLQLSIIALALVGLTVQTECKKETKKTTNQTKSSYEQLEDQYKKLAQSFEKLEKQRKLYAAKNPSRDEMAKLDYEIAQKREQADKIYSEMGEFPQFSTFEGKALPASPKYKPTDDECKECIANSKKLNKDVKKLTNTVSKK